MSISLFCLVKGNTTANAFSVKISSDETISELKKAIKAEKQNDFAGVDANELKLWKVEIADGCNDLLSNLSLKEKDELSALKKISKYFSDLPAKECIYVIVKPLVSTITSNREHKLPNQIASLQALLNKSVHGIYICHLHYTLPLFIFY